MIVINGFLGDWHAVRGPGVLHQALPHRHSAASLLQHQEQLLWRQRGAMREYGILYFSDYFYRYLHFNKEDNLIMCIQSWSFNRVFPFITILRIKPGRYIHSTEQSEHKIYFLLLPEVRVPLGAVLEVVVIVDKQLRAGPKGLQRDHAPDAAVQRM